MSAIFSFSAFIHGGYDVGTIFRFATIIFVGTHRTIRLPFVQGVRDLRN